ncbi:MAG: L-threonylcarbamoyladenylate synthase [Gammaproteobacteria bacterium]
MTQLFRIHPDNPQVRLLRQIATIVHQEGGVLAYPTDSGYALGCRLGDKHASDRIREIRQLSEERNFTLVCSDLSQVSNYAKIDKNVFRILKEYTPGPYTFILPATKSVPKRIQNEKHKTIGVRIPGNAVVRALLDELREPLMSVTLFLPGEVAPFSTAEEIYEKLNRQVDIIIDADYCPSEPTTVIDFSQGADPVIVRVGKGNPNPFLPNGGNNGNNNVRGSFSQIYSKLK